MAASAPPYMPLYVGDYLGDTTHLSCLEHGAYLLLLMAMWRAGGRLPADDARLARFAKLSPPAWARARPTLIGFFEVGDGAVSHARLTRELERYRATIAQRRDAGARSAAAKTLKRRAAGATGAGPPLQQPEPEPDSPSGETPSGEARRTRRVPCGWRPSPQDLEAAAGLGFDEDRAARQLAIMRDHEFANPRSDWSATFRNWLRRAPRFEAPDDRPDPRLARRQDNLGRALSGFDAIAGDDRSE